MDKFLQLYIKSFKLHIGTKTTDLVLHQFLETVYEFLFKVNHTLSEKRQDLGLDPSIGCEDGALSTQTILEEAETIINSMIKQDNSYGMDNLLRSLAEELEFIKGNAKGFVKEVEEEKEETKEETVEPKETLGMRKGLKIK